MVGGEALKTAEPVETQSEADLRVDSVYVDLPVEPLPEVDELERMIDEQNAVLHTLRGNPGTPKEKTSAARIRPGWAEDTLRLVGSGESQQTVKMEIQVLRLGDAAFVCLPAELFVKMMIK